MGLGLGVGLGLGLEVAVGVGVGVGVCLPERRTMSAGKAHWTTFWSGDRMTPDLPKVVRWS